MVLSHIEIIENKVIVPIEEWDEIIAKLKKIEKVEIKNNAAVKTWKRKINKVKINGKPISDTIIEERNENIF